MLSIAFLAPYKALKSLTISSYSIQDISMLKTVEVLDISNCPSIKSLTGLTALKELNISGVECIESGFEVFHQLTKLTIGRVSNWVQMVQVIEKAPFLSSLTLKESNLPINSFIHVKEFSDRYHFFTKFPATLLRFASWMLTSFVSFPVFLPSFLPCGFLSSMIREDSSH
jgi:Zn ribbon nucleic-acid-binding protein